MQINSNLLSLHAQRSYQRAGEALGVSLQRLSSGQRINSASDDAAGLVISERLGADARGLRQAARNVNDGISLLQVADGAVGQIVNNLQRIRELAVQAGNGTNNGLDRKAIQQEVDALVASNLDIAGQTRFNRLKLLDGSYNTQLQVGANANDVIGLAIPFVFQPAASGMVSVNVPEQQVSVSAQVTGALSAGSLTLNGVAIPASVAGAGPGQNPGSAYAVAGAINASGATGVVASAANSISGTVAASGNIGAGVLAINGVALGAIVGANANALAAAAAATINGAVGATGVSASSSGGTLTLSAADGRDIGLAGGAFATLGQGLGNHVGTITVLDAASGGTHNLLVGGSNPGAAGLTGGAYASSNTGNTVTVLVAQGASGEPAIDMSSVEGATAALDYLDGKIDDSNAIRAYLGATENRLELAFDGAVGTATNLDAARSRIRDTDYASETAQLTRAQILRQAGASMLAQANALPQRALLLLR